MAVMTRYRPAPGQLVPLVVLGATPGVRAALDAAGIGHVACAEPEQAAEVVDRVPGAVLGYGPGVFGRALSARPVRVEPAEDGEPLRSLALVDGIPADLPRGAVDDDARRLVHKARVPLRVRWYVDLSEAEHVEALRGVLATM